MQHARIQLCGAITAEVGGRRVDAQLPGRQGRLLFVYLVLGRATPFSRDELAAAIWPDHAPAKAEAGLRVVLSRLRAVLGAETITGRAEVRFDLGADVRVDLETAEAKIHEAEAAAVVEDWPRAMAAAAAAYAISGRGFLAGEDAPWVAERRALLEDVHLRALEFDATASLHVGGSELAAVKRDARRLMHLSPYRESGYRLLMEALEAEGNGAEALVVYEQLRTLLRDDLGTTPSPKTLAVHRRLLEA